MKRILTFALTAILAVSLAVPTFAADKIGANSAKVAVTVAGVSTEAPKLDGKIGKYEYQEIKYTADDIRYNGTDDAYLASLEKSNFKLYASYSKDIMYVAVVVNTPNYSQTKEASSIWQEYSCQLSTAKGDEKTAANRSEYGFARSSKDDKLIFNAWADAYKANWKPELSGKDFAVVTEGDVTTYEMAIPAKSFGVESLNKGGKVRMNICMNMGSDTVGDKKRGQIEWSQGCGNGKDATKFAVLTLGDAIEIPKAPAKPAAATADAVSAAIIALAISATAAVVVANRKH